MIYSNQTILDKIASKHPDDRFGDLVKLMGELDPEFENRTYITTYDDKPGLVVVESVLSDRELGDKLKAYFGDKKGHTRINKVIGDRFNVPHHTPACISYVRRFKDGLVQFAGFSMEWSSTTKKEIMWAKYGHLPANVEKTPYSRAWDTLVEYVRSTYNGLLKR